MTTEMTKADHGFALLGGDVEIRRTGLTISRPLAFDEWQDLGAGLQAIESGIQWVLGDWVNYGDQRYGEKYAQAVEDTGYAYQSLADMAWVAGRIEPSRRRENLSFSHHRAVAVDHLTAPEQDQLLSAAEAGHWSVKAIKEAVATFRLALAAPAHELPAGVASVTDADDTASPPPQDAVDPIAEWERAEQRIAALEAELASLTTNDTDRELRKLHAQTAQLSARVNALLTEKAEARRQADYAEGVLRKIRKALGVERDRDILPAIEGRTA